MSGLEDATASELGWKFLDQQAAVVMLRVDSEGIILSANWYARALTGLSLDSGSLRDLLVITTEEAELQRWLTPSPEPRMMNIRTLTGLPQTLYVTSVQIGFDLLLFGQADPREQERLRCEFLELNHELTALGRELALANAELARLNELKNKFLGMASHDLRKPAGLILNRAEMLLEDASVKSSADAFGNIKSIIDSATSMARLIDDFLDVTMIESGRFNLDIQVVEQEGLVARAWTLVQVAAEKRGIYLKTSLDGATARIRVDGPKIEQVLTNLLSNAVEYSPQGACISVASLLQAEGIRFWVEDQGIGVDLEQRQRLFEAFASSGGVKQSGERSIGLGLVIVRKIIEAHGGTCFVESPQGVGSRFGFVLPDFCRTATTGNLK
jgi:signal transduction histidine kinase